MRDAVLLLPGVLAAAVGGELFVRGTVGGAARARIAPGIIAATVAAFATSSPEMSVAVNSALAGSPEISLGDVLGSNVVNVGVVLALAMLLGGLRPRREDVRRDIPPALAAPVLVLVLGLDGQLGRLDAAIMLACFVAWLSFAAIQAARERSHIAEVTADKSAWQIARDGILGMALLILAGRLIVLAADDFGDLLGWDTFTVGAVLVAIATSVPELATVVLARLRGFDEVSVGTVLGSNIFNGLLVVGVAAAITPIPIAWDEFRLTVVAGIVTVLLVIPGRSTRFGPLRGLTLLAVYAAYVAILLLSHEGAV
jgi:cation:H+ antiporter